MPKQNKCSLVGIPDDQAVTYVQGRTGAKEGPTAFRRIFAKMRSRNPIHDSVDDLGDVPGMGTDVSQNHQLAADHVREGQLKNGLSVIIGGSHDHGYSHLLGIREALSLNRKKPVRLGCINLDAHLDVRQPAPWITSGSPFYLALEGGILDPKRFIEFGIQSHCNSRELWDYVRKKKVQVLELNPMRGGRAVSIFKKTFQQLASKCDAIVISLDLDAASSAFAPGVSAPQAEGFTSSELLEMVEISAKNPKTVSLGLFELNPKHDIDDRTARLAATVAYHFMDSALFEHRRN